MLTAATISVERCESGVGRNPPRPLSVHRWDVRARCPKFFFKTTSLLSLVLRRRPYTNCSELIAVQTTSNVGRLGNVISHD